MKKYLSVIATILLSAVIATTFFGCSKKEAADKKSNAVNKNSTVSNKLEENLVLEKIGTLDLENFYSSNAGVYYRNDDNKLYGVVSKEGLNDTGAIYTSCTPFSSFFEVSYKKIENYKNASEVNSRGLVDCNGRVIIPCEYAKFSKLNDKYIQAIAVTEITSGDDYFLSYSSTNEKILYNAKWCVYNVETGTKVPGVSGNKNISVYAYGNYISYYDENGDKAVVDGKGNKLPENSKLFNNGCYTVEGKIGDLYDTNGKKLFSYDLTGFVPVSSSGKYLNSSGKYFIAKQYADDVTKYAVMDEKGTIVSSEFKQNIDVVGELIESEGKIYNFKGKNIIAGEYDSIEAEEIFSKYFMLRQDDDYKIIDIEGNVYFSGSNDDTHCVYSDYFAVYEEQGDDKAFYSFKDKDYTLKGYTLAPWIIKAETTNHRYDAINTLTGEKLLEGYSDYSYAEYNSFSYIIYAKYAGGADIYLVTSGNKLVNVAEKKQNLFDDLTAAFNKEGIKITVNKATGEMALDASVLFGGDSAELTEEGKDFLKKFIKAYTTVAFSDKYEGFITKTLVEGHTAPVAGSTYASGLQLSEERAANVKTYCLSSEIGVDVSKIAETLEDIGYSNSQPVYDSNGKVDMDASRRVSFRFLVNVGF